MEVAEKKSKSSSITAGLLGIGVSVAILVYLGRTIHWAEVGLSLKKAQISFILLWIAVTLVGIFIRAHRWMYILPTKAEKQNFWDYYHSLNIGNFATMVLPLRAGEFLRPLYFSRWTGETFTRSFASVVVERVFDLCGMFLMFFLFVYGRPEVPGEVLFAAASLGGVCACIVVGMVLSYVMPDKILYLSQFPLKILPESIGDKILHLIEEFIAGLRSIKGVKELLYISLSSAILWFSYVYAFNCCLMAFGEASNITAGAVACVFVGLWIAVPSAPGFFGTFELGCLSALTGVFAYQKEFSVAYALLAHFLTFGMIILIGLISLYLKGLNLSALRSSQ